MKIYQTLQIQGLKKDVEVQSILKVILHVSTAPMMTNQNIVLDGLKSVANMNMVVVCPKPWKKVSEKIISMIFDKCLDEFLRF